jgi:putative ABC transport system substrate-binding protein
MTLNKEKHPVTRRTMLLLALAACLAFWPQSGRACEIAVLKSADLKPYRDVIRGLRDASLCTIEESGLNDVDGPEAIVGKETSAVVAVGTASFRKVRAVRDIPVLYVMVIPSEIGPSLAPNISGVGMDAAPRDYLAAMREVLPRAKRIAVLSDPSHTKRFVDEASRAAGDEQMELLVRQVRGPAGIPTALDGLPQDVDILWMLPDPTVSNAAAVDYLLRYAIGHNVPVFTFSRKYVEMGAVASLDVDPYDMGVQLAELAQRVINGAAGPVRVAARKTRLTINKKTAGKMGIKAIVLPAGRGN